MFLGIAFTEALALIGFVLFFIGVNITFMLTFVMGVKGMPRRYYDYAMFPQFASAQMIAIAIVVSIMDYISSVMREKYV